MAFFQVNYAIGEQADFSFSTVYSNSLNYYGKDIPANCTDTTHEGLSKLIAKSTWSIAELDTLHCLFARTDQENALALYGLICYIGGNAYANFDDKIRDSLYHKAYFTFKDLNDKFGMFFSLSNLLAYTQFQSGNDFKKYDFEAFYNEISILKSELDFIPAHLTFADIFLRRKFYFNEIITIDQLDSLSIFCKNYAHIYPILVAELYSVIGFSQRLEGNYSKAFQFYKKSLDLSDSTSIDYFSFLSNLGTGYYLLEQFDSAMFLWKKAYHCIQDPHSGYLLESKSAIAKKIAVVFEKNNQTDSAQHYNIVSLQLANKKLALERDESNLYLARKFELTKKQQAITDLNLVVSRKQNRLIITYGVSAGLLLLLIFTSVLFFNQKKLSKQKAALAKERELLVRTVGHDLATPLQLFSTSAALIPKLIEQNRWEDLNHVTLSLNKTLVALQSMLNNLFAWNSNKKNIQKTKLEKEPIALASFLEDIKAIYTLYFEEKGLTINISILPTQIIHTNPIHLGILMRNLIYNCAKHGAENTEVLLTVSQNAQNINIEIQNTVAPAGLTNASNFAQSINQQKITKTLKHGLGLELILHSIKKLKAKAKANLTQNILSINIVFPK